LGHSTNPDPPPQTPLSGFLGSFANPHNYCIPERFGFWIIFFSLFFFFGKAEEAGKSLSKMQSV
jgi:hypothetical protein